MARVLLLPSGVAFDAEHHTYTLDGRELVGITPTIRRQLFPDEYDGVPREVLDRAAAKGTSVHDECNLLDCGMLDVPTSLEGQRYIGIKAEYGLAEEMSEYIVTDRERYASPIDKVYRAGDDTFHLADIKTTYKLNIDYVRWQLSIYAYLFELQNPAAHAVRLSAIWLRPDKAELVDVERIPTDVVRDLLATDAQGGTFANPFAPAVTEQAMPAKWADMLATIAEIEQQADYWSKKKKELADGILKEMQKAGVTKWECDGMSFTRKKDSVRTTFDSTAFKKAHADLYQKFTKSTPVTGGLIIKIK